jgi:hypothetical protein
MAAMDDDVSIAYYSKLLVNFGTAYTATQESSNYHGHGRYARPINEHPAMAVGQQPPPNIYAPAQQQHTFNNRRDRCNGRGHNNGGAGGGNGGGSFPQQQAWFGGNGASTQHPMRPPTPYKHWENWNYCHTHGGDVDDTHTSALCGNRGPTHNPNVTRANIMGGLC